MHNVGQPLVCEGICIAIHKESFDVLLREDGANVRLEIFMNWITRNVSKQIRLLVSLNAFQCELCAMRVVVMLIANFTAIRFTNSCHARQLIRVLERLIQSSGATWSLLLQCTTVNRSVAYWLKLGYKTSATNCSEVSSRSVKRVENMAVFRWKLPRP